MKTWLLTLLFIFPMAMGISQPTEYYMGEMKSRSPNEEEAQHYGLFFLKRTFFPEQNRFIDTCFLSAEDGDDVELQQISDLTGDLHEVILSDSDGLITGTGELVGLPWEWTSLQERIQINMESPIEVDVKNTFNGRSMIWNASIFTLDDGGNRNFFCSFSANLYRVEAKMIMDFFKGTETYEEIAGLVAADIFSNKAF